MKNTATDTNKMAEIRLDLLEICAAQRFMNYACGLALEGGETPSLDEISGYHIVMNGLAKRLENIANSLSTA